MASLKEVEDKIAKLARRSTDFKIGKTGQHNCKRLAQQEGFECSEVITWSADKETINELEGKMIEKFKHWKNNANVNGGSAGPLKEKSDKYSLYVVCNLRK